MFNESIAIRSTHYQLKGLSTIQLTTLINAPAERVFDLSRSIDLHTISTAHTNEQAVAGLMTGLISQGETVTWQAKHLFKTRRFTSIIIALQKPLHFTDKMIQGDFKSFKHLHRFKRVESGTLMTDLLKFESPYSIAGKLIDMFFLKSYLQNYY